ncbi:MAG: TonB-dependent receptor [Bacteroidetes bacterium]|nr:TonB-dependent receptor [Bacteroidota bacterium]
MKKNHLILLLLLAFPMAVMAQTNPVKGKVVSAVDKEPLAGVTIFVKGTRTIATTSMDGTFTLNAAPSDVLVVSYIGFIPQEVTVGTIRDFEIFMNEDSKFLDEVVVIGYGVQKKSLVTGAISKVTANDLEKSLPTRFEDVLNGKVSGIQILQQSGQPGSGSDVYIRGIGTVNNSGPLYVVDGMQIEGNISFLNPKDIESVEVLKDAASAAIYGTRGANGVILITTKSGVKGQRMVNYDFNYGWQNPWKKREVLNAQEYMTIMNEMAINDGGSFKFSADEIRNAKTTDWQDEIFNYNAPVINHSISMSGGGENNTYAISFGYLKQDGIIGGNFGKSNLERYNFRTNASQVVYETKTRSFLNKLNVGVNVSYTHQEDTNVDSNSQFNSILTSALMFGPHYSVYEDAAVLADPNSWYNQYIDAGNPDSGKWIDIVIKDENGKVYRVPLQDKYNEIGNPVAMLANKRQYQINKQDVFVGGVWGELDIWKGIKLHSSYTVDMSFWGNNGYNLPYYVAAAGKFIENLDKANIYGQKNQRFSWQIENYLTWTEQFNQHHVTVTAGQSALKTTQSQVGGSRGRPIFDTHDLLMNINNTEAVPSLYNIYGYYSGSDVNFYALASYFGRINYNFGERYIFSASIRRDGSSRFGPDKKWGLFPAISVAWNILNEPYIYNKPVWMDAAKVRASWGRNGNDRIGELRYVTTDARGSAYDYYFGGAYNPATLTWNGQLVAGVQPGALENRVLAWEQSEQTNIGIDLTFLRGAFNFSFDWYKKSTIGMLQTAIIPPSTGQSAPIANVGDMSNRGVEINAGYKGNVGSFHFYVDANATYVKTVLDKYANQDGIQRNLQSAGNAGIGEFMRGQTGEVYPFFYGLKTNGLFQNWDEINRYTWTNPETGVTQLIQPNAHPGDVRFIDMNGDGSITEADKIKTGKPMPDWIMGINIGGDWKGFDFSLFFKSSLGFQIFDFSQRQDVSAFNRPAWVLDRWHGEGTSNTVPRVTASDPNGNFMSSDLNLKNGDYLRLKTAQLGYTLPARITHIIGLQKVRMYVAGYNLLTFTKYDGFDIELDHSSVDYGVYPQSRTVAVGVNVTF